MSIDLARPWALDDQVALRPEPFGALAYHFGTRRLSFLKSRKLLAVVECLGEQPTAQDACVTAGVTETEMAAYAGALQTLAASGMIHERGAS